MLRSRKASEGPSRGPVDHGAELAELYERRLLQAPTGSVQAEQDRKQLFRRLLRELGGVSADRLAAEFKTLLAALKVDKRITNSDGAVFGRSVGASAFATSAGFSG